MIGDTRVREKKMKLNLQRRYRKLCGPSVIGALLIASCQNDIKGIFYYFYYYYYDYYYTVAYTYLSRFRPKIK